MFVLKKQAVHLKIVSAELSRRVSMAALGGIPEALNRKIIICMRFKMVC